MDISKHLLIIFSLMLIAPGFSQSSQRITGKVLVETKEGEKPGAYVNVIVYKGKEEIARGKTLGDGTFELFPKGAFFIIPDFKYTVVVEPDPKEKKFTGYRIKKAKIKVSGSELEDLTIYTSLVKNRDAMRDERAGHFEGSQ